MKQKGIIKKLISGISLVLIILGLIIPSNNWINHHVSSAQIVYNSRLSPIIFIPGSNASVDRFDGLFKQLNSGAIKRSIVKIKVKEDDQLEVKGKLKPRDLQPFFVVGFEDNADGYSHIKKQAKWFDIAMTFLRSHYYFNNFSGVGHSNGGLIYTIYLENYLNQDDLEIKSLITIATPFNFNESKIEKRTQMLNDLIKQRSHLPKNLVLVSIAGTKNYTDDGTVPSQSVEAGKYIYQTQIKNYTHITVTGSNSDHSDLVQNPQVVDIIQNNTKGLIGREPNSNFPDNHPITKKRKK